MGIIKLKELQKKFIKYIYYEELDDNFLDNIKSKSKIESLKIYRRNSILSLVGSLKATFYSVFLILGEKQFNYLAFEYTEKYPSKSGNLDLYGFSFIEFLSSKNIEPTYILDIAKTDLSFHKLSMMANYNSSNIEKFKHISEQDYENLILIINPVHELLVLDYDIANYWVYMHKNEEVNNQAIINKNTNILLLYRDKFHSIHSKCLNESDFLFFTLIKKKIKFFEIFTCMLKKYQNFDLQASLKHFIENQIIIDFCIL